MRRAISRPRRRGFATWLGYRLDRFLGLSPLVQLGTLLVLAFLVALAFGTGIYLAEGERGEVRSVRSGLWWAITHMLDGGTLAGDATLRTRAFGVGVTLIGLVAVAVLTGAFASSFAERVRAIRSGTLPILERGHLLLLGWNARGGVVLRELAVSGLTRTVVILTNQDRELVEEQAREQLLGISHRLGVIVRRGDPASISSVRRVAARRAEVALVLVDGDAITGSAADRSVLRSLLALRRVTSQRPPRTLVEVWSSRGRELLRLCAPTDDVVIVDAHDSSARLLAHSLRQPGTFDVVRQLLSLNGRSIYLHRAGRFAGKTFDAAHAALDPGILIGIVHGGKPALSPPGDRVIGPGDHLLVFEDEDARPAAGGELPAPSQRKRRAPRCQPLPPRALEVLVVRFKPELDCVLETLGSCAGAELRATVLVAPDEVAGPRALEHRPLPCTSLDIVVGDPLGGEALDRALARGPQVVLLLAPDVPSEQAGDADADQLVTLLYVLRAAPRDTRVVAEVRSPETARLIGGRAGVEAPGGERVDFVLARELVGMLLAQEIHLSCLRRDDASSRTAVYQDIFDALGSAIRMEPLSRYAEGHELPDFAHLLGAARRKGQIALGVIEEPLLPTPDRPAVSPSAYLLPRRDERFEVSDGARLIVVTPGDAPTAHVESSGSSGAEADADADEEGHAAQ